MTPSHVSRIITKQELCLLEKVPEPCGIVIFGASGDLTARKLAPALHRLGRDGVLPGRHYVLGVARSPLSDDRFRALVSARLPPESADPGGRHDFLSRWSYMAGDYEDPALGRALAGRLAELDATRGIRGNHLFYLATPPALAGPIVSMLDGAGLVRASDGGGWARVVVEKPFGTDRASARALNRALRARLAEEQIYRIDHYLGKETVQNILMLRFANTIFEPVWNSKFIDSVQITAAETDGVGRRAGYYEGAGALRDMFQNHLLQLLSLVAMEPPSSFRTEALRAETAKVMDVLAPLDLAGPRSPVVRGQYIAPASGAAAIPAYRQEPGVGAESTTETFAALKAELDCWRWQGVPFYLRSGKRLTRHCTEIAVRFRNVPASIFKPLLAEQIAPNVLTMRIQPDEGISLRFEAKHPGPKLCMSSVTMDFGYAEAFGVDPPEAYARLLLDVMLGDQTLFAREDWVDQSWKFIDPILALWAEAGPRGLEFYPAGSWGPQGAEVLLARDGRQWLAE